MSKGVSLIQVVRADKRVKKESAAHYPDMRRANLPPTPAENV